MRTDSELISVGTVDGGPMTLTETLEPLVLRRAYSAFPTGVAALAALVGDQPQGIAVSSFTSVSIDPPMVLVCVAHTSTTWPLLSQPPRIGISASAWFECSVDQQTRAGDHDIVVLRVHDLEADHAASPLVFHASRLRQLHPEPTEGTGQ